MLLKSIIQNVIQLPLLFNGLLKIDVKKLFEQTWQKKLFEFRRSGG